MSSASIPIESNLESSENLPEVGGKSSPADENRDNYDKAMANSPLVSMWAQPESGKKGAKVIKRKGDSSAKTAVPKSGKKMKKVGGVVVKLEHKNVGPTWISKLVQNFLSFMVVSSP